VTEESVKVFFIGGYGRSGSTLLDRMLGQFEGFFSGGELRHIWDRSFGDNQLCGCGRPFKECDFWTAVVEDAFGGFGGVKTDAIKVLKRSVDRMRYIPLMISSRKPSWYRERFEAYSEVLSKLYKAIQRVSGSQIIIDSSKDPSHGFLLHSMPWVDLRVVHLIRDSRAVAYSWSRKKARPEIPSKKEYMPRYGPVKSALGWIGYDVWAQSLEHLTHSSALVFYEDLVSHPERELSRIVAALGEGYRGARFVNGDKVFLEANHTVSGNPVRFQLGPIRLRPDIEWRRKMERGQRRLVTALTLPFLARYGYLGKSRNQRMV